MPARLWPLGVVRRAGEDSLDQIVGAGGIAVVEEI